MTERERLILALDVPDRESALRAVSRWGRRVGMVKIGLELFVAAGPELVREVRQRDAGVFLDLKLHDIPNTVAGAVHSAARLDVQMLTIHAGGGPRMLAAAVAAAAATPGLTLLGVTVLTSLDMGELATLGMPGTAADRAVNWAKLCKEAGLGGAVCSAHEVAAVRRACGPGMKLVVPGIRPRGAPVGDQARVATPAEARAAGADYLVVGRAITAAADPDAALEAVLAEMQALSERSGN